MKSVRDFVTKKLVSTIEKDLQRFRIFNEADLQYRAAYHLQRYVSQWTNVYLMNQPNLKIGYGRGSAPAKPDIMLVDHDIGPSAGPFAVFELKCFLDRERLMPNSVVKQVWADIENLGRFKKRFQGNEAAFAIVVLNLDDFDKYSLIRKDLDKLKRQQEWAAHHLYIHTINTFCFESGRKRKGYDQWQKDWCVRREIARGHSPKQQVRSVKKKESFSLKSVLKGLGI